MNFGLFANILRRSLRRATNESGREQNSRQNGGKYFIHRPQDATMQAFEASSQPAGLPLKIAVRHNTVVALIGAALGIRAADATGALPVLTVIDPAESS